MYVFTVCDILVELSTHLAVINTVTAHKKFWIQVEWDILGGETNVAVRQWLWFNVVQRIHSSNWHIFLSIRYVLVKEK